MLAAKIAEPHDETSISSIKHEGTILSQVQGDNIIRLIHFHDGTVYDDLPPYLILEWAEDSLENMINKRRAYFPTELLLNMFLQISMGMRQVNQRFVHCDLNPSNILLVGNTLKIADFGVAEPIGQPPSESEFSQHRHLLYVAPEYWSEANNAVEMDIYCAGLIFYQAATLQQPYNIPSEEGDDQSVYRYAHINQIPINPSKLNTRISPKLSDLILRMMAKKPEDRFHSWDEIITILNECVAANQQNRAAQ